MSEKNEEKVDIDTEKTDEEEVEDIDLDLEDEDEDDDKKLTEEEKDKLIETLKSQKNHWRGKAKELENSKGEDKDKKPATPKPADTKPKAPTLSSIDLYALIEAKVPKEDIEDVVKASQLLKKDISSAINDPVVKAILKEKAELRATENAASTKNKRASVKTESEQQILEKVSKGEIPEPGSEAAEKLFWARRGGKR